MCFNPPKYKRWAGHPKYQSRVHHTKTEAERLTVERASAYLISPPPLRSSAQNTDPTPQLSHSPHKPPEEVDEPYFWAHLIIGICISMLVIIPYISTLVTVPYISTLVIVPHLSTLVIVPYISSLVIVPHISPGMRMPHKSKCLQCPVHSSNRMS